MAEENQQTTTDNSTQQTTQDNTQSLESVIAERDAARAALEEARKLNASYEQRYSVLDGEIKELKEKYEAEISSHNELQLNHAKLISVAKGYMPADVPYDREMKLVNGIEFNTDERKVTGTPTYEPMKRISEPLTGQLGSTGAQTPARNSGNNSSQDSYTPILANTVPNTI